MIDLCIHCGTKFALHQWLQARGLGDNQQDADPESPTFGDYFYRHTAEGDFVYWNHPSGVLTNTPAVTDSEGNVTTPATFFNGFWAMLRVQGDTIPVEDWVRDNTGIVNQQGFPGYGGEGVTVVAPDVIFEHLQANGAAPWGMLGGDFWTDPRAWVPGPVMTGDEREFGGQTYRSLIDFNVWSPTQYPQGWELVEVVEPPPNETPEWETGVSYSIDDVVTYQGTEYACIQAHTSQAGWNPAAVPALWSPV